MNHEQLERRVRVLTVATATLSLLLVLVVLGGAGYASTRFQEIDVERINVVEADGRLAMVIANGERFPDAVFDGRVLYERNGLPGILFYNDEGGEMGGLTFTGSGSDSTHHSSGHLSFDQYRQDQGVALRYGSVQDRGQMGGLDVWDRPGDLSLGDMADDVLAARSGDEDARRRVDSLGAAGVYGAHRLYVGTEWDGSAVLRMEDGLSRERFRIVVGSDGGARLEFVDENGNVTFALPEQP